MSHFPALHPKHDPDVARQRAYYQRTADSYDRIHTHAEVEHDINARWFSLFIHGTGARSLLDVGTGTGRLLTYFRQAHPDLRLVGIEPVAALREIAFKNGFSAGEIIDGDACALPFPDGSFDFVCESAVLHHIRQPNRAVAEMLRVARIGILISDSNRFGQGRSWTRPLKRALWKLGAWPLVTLLQTRGRGYLQSEEDGISYSYSVFDHERLFRRAGLACHVFNPDGRGPHPLYHAATVGLAALNPGYRLGESNVSVLPKRQNYAADHPIGI